MYNMMSSVFVAASAIVPSPAPMPAAKPANINAASGLASFPPFAVIAPMPAVTTASPAPIAAPRLAPSPRPSFEGDVIVRMSDFGITAQPEGLRRSRSDADRPRNWPLIRSPAFSSTTMGDAISKAETFSHRPGITSACAGCADQSPQDQGEDLGPAGFHLWGYHLRTSFFPEETLLVAGDAHGHRRTIALLPPVGRPHQGQEVHINKCDFFVEMGSPRRVGEGRHDVSDGEGIDRTSSTPFNFRRFETGLAAGTTKHHPEPALKVRSQTKPTVFGTG